MCPSPEKRSGRHGRKYCARSTRSASPAAEARRNAGEVIPFDSYEGSEDRTGWYSREPLGIIAAITPFNDPLNLVAHKIGPAIAGGNAVILKPSALTPLSAQLLTDALVELRAPAGSPHDCSRRPGRGRKHHSVPGRTNGVLHRGVLHWGEYRPHRQA